MKSIAGIDFYTTYGGFVIYLKLTLRELTSHTILQPAHQVLEGGHHPRRIFTFDNWILLSECRYLYHMK